jgi:hypothetical protein
VRAPWFLMKGVVQLGPNPFHQIKRLRLLQLLYENCTDSLTCEANTPNFGQNGNQLVEYKQLTIRTAGGVKYGWEGVESLLIKRWGVGRVKDEQSQLGITAICFFGTILYGETEFTAILIFWIDWGIQKIGWKYGRKYKGFSKFIKGQKIPTRISIFLVLSNFIAKIGWTGVIAEVQTVV